MSTVVRESSILSPSTVSPKSTFSRNAVFISFLSINETHFAYDCAGIDPEVECGQPADDRQGVELPHPVGGDRHQEERRLHDNAREGVVQVHVVQQRGAWCTEDVIRGEQRLRSNRVELNKTAILVC